MITCACIVQMWRCSKYWSPVEEPPDTPSQQGQTEVLPHPGGGALMGGQDDQQACTVGDIEAFAPILSSFLLCWRESATIEGRQEVVFPGQLTAHGEGAPEPLFGLGEREEDWGGLPPHHSSCVPRGWRRGPSPPCGGCGWLLGCQGRHCHRSPG